MTMLEPEGRIQVDAVPIQAHYDQADALFASFLDPETRMYTCAYYPTGKETLGQAQIEMVDRMLPKLQLKPGQKLLEVGFGWGWLLRRAQDQYDIEGIGLTLSQNQAEYAREKAAGQSNLEYRLQGWEEFSEPVDAIFVKGAFEHFGKAKYKPFFERAKSVLSKDGLMLLHTIFIDVDKKPIERQPKRAFAQFMRFLGNDIFPKGYLPTRDMMVVPAQEAGFELVGEERFGPHYVPTLIDWSVNLARNYDQAVAVTNEATYLMYQRYFRQAAFWFGQGSMNVGQFLFRANSLSF